jgi:hypothetical protein
MYPAPKDWDWPKQLAQPSKDLSACHDVGNAVTSKKKYNKSNHQNTLRGRTLNECPATLCIRSYNVGLVEVSTF